MQHCFPTHSRSKVKCPKENHMRSLHWFYIFNELPCSWSSVGIPPAAQVLFHVPSWIQRAARLFPHLHVHFNFIRSQRTWRSYFFSKGLSSNSKLPTINIRLKKKRCKYKEIAICVCFSTKGSSVVFALYLLVMTSGAESNVPFLNPPFLYCSLCSGNRIRKKSRGQTSLASSRLTNPRSVSHLIKITCTCHW